MCVQVSCLVVASGKPHRKRKSPFLKWTHSILFLKKGNCNKTKEEEGPSNLFIYTPPGDGFCRRGSRPLKLSLALSSKPVRTQAQHRLSRDF